MKVNIQLEDFQATFPSLVKDCYTVIGTEEAGTWIVRKKEEVKNFTNSKYWIHFSISFP